MTSNQHTFHVKQLTLLAMMMFVALFSLLLLPLLGSATQIAIDTAPHTNYYDTWRQTTRISSSSSSSSRYSSYPEAEIETENELESSNNRFGGSGGVVFPNSSTTTRELTKGSFPNVFNLATGAIITVNATCGETRQETYCRLTEHVDSSGRGNATACSICDAFSSDLSKRHPISQAIDGTESWWQSPTLQNGKRYEWVTININLRQPYEVAYVVLKSAISPLPLNWILERSIDGINYYPWQYFAGSDTECWDRYRVRPITGKVRYRTDDEVICTSYYAKHDVLKDGEVHVSLVNGRPGAEDATGGISASLQDFTKAQYIRIRMQKIRSFMGSIFYDPNDLDKADSTLTRRLFYSIKDITIGGKCLCNGHANECASPEPLVTSSSTYQPSHRSSSSSSALTISSTALPKCICQHNTCGKSCEKCCPLFNQRKWRPGTSVAAESCEQCQCHGHSNECEYDQTIADKRLSLNMAGVYEGGGVCVRCKHHTTGINCEQCEDGFYRPEDVPADAEWPCKKCSCSGAGMSRFCVKDDSHFIEGRRPGDCICREGFEGARCERCAKGYRNYPRCDQCTCVYAGIVNTDVCDGQCFCKRNVEGVRCNKCKDSFYNLATDNPEGCSKCYCFGATDRCKPSDYGIEIIRSPDGWRVTDVPRSFTLQPSPENGRLSIANDEVPVRSQKLYYWEAPEEYLGRNLYSYGNSLKYVINYVVARGDTSGVFTDEPDVILEGGPDNIRIGMKWHKPPVVEDAQDDLNATIIMPLREQGWFRVDEDGKRIPDSVPTREEFTLALYDMKRLLVRAKFHTDQVEGGMYMMDLERASNSSKSIQKAIGTEQCDCPPGYGGLSCEYCLPGYRRVNNILVNGICEKCNCNNHALSCDPYTGACSECLHNTTGPNCGECKPGFYGDATRGKEDDCKPCACPLNIPTNNFSPTCRLDATAKYGYRCLECPEGYTGERCEICANGYFGNPLIPGGFCAPCDCGPNANTTMDGWCDHITGQCKYCSGNTAGWKCDECLPDHWGNPEAGDCRPCDCDAKGAKSTQCNAQTGQCECRPNYTGPKCDRCAPGYGNVELDCPPCDCNLTGSIDGICDQETGQCHCKPGVTGQHCDRCVEGNYGFSIDGCKWCNCNKLGSEGPDCNEANGQCICKPFVTGRDCSNCEPGYWNLASNKGCEPCNCNFTGSYSNVCDELSGQCQCKPGVGGLHCDQCLPGYYGFSAAGCKKCDPCDAPGHICDQKTGKCVCPPNTAGPTCNDCAPGTWGHDILTGCSPCDCNMQGSVSNECNHKTGECVCLDGFEGRHCEKCKFGYYRFPNCRKCDCHEPGTLPGSCRGDGLCQCDETGQCPCRENVSGRRCDICKEATFALSADNPLGCFSCFCFGKSVRCEQSSMVWTERVFPQREIFFSTGTTEIKNVLGFKTIPADTSSVGVRNTAVELQTPFYWSLPTELLNDQVVSYNGLLHFRLYARGGGKLSDDVLARYPLVVLQGNHRLILYHYGPKTASVSGLFHIRFHENEWKRADNPEYPVTRDVLMVALQKVQHILVRSTDLVEANYIRMSDLSYEVAVAGGFSSRQAIGVEECRCPPQYTAPSCQDPNIGYYRKRKPNYLDSKDILDLVGWAEPCQCYNYSRICDRETGECLNCEGFTTGPHCNLCIKGYYGDPTRGIPCKKCACPTLVNSFSETCELVAGSASEYVCTACQEGYAGRHCEMCADGYWGNPLAPNGRCIPCQCSPIGSLSNVCDKQTGQCPCKEGITGKDCSNCPPRHVVTPTGCLNCDDDCTGLLLDDIDFLKSIVHEANLTDVANLPWTRLMHLTKNLNRTQHNMNIFKSKVRHGNDMIRNFTVNFDLETLADLLNMKARDLTRQAPRTAEAAKETLIRAQNVKDLINDLWQAILNIIEQLKRHGIDSSDPLGSSSDRMFEEAQRILNELRLRDFNPDIRTGQNELKRTLNLLEKVLQMLTEREHSGPVRERLDKLMRLLAEIYDLINKKIFPETRETFQKLASIRPTLAQIREHLDNSTRTAAITNSTLTEARELLELIRKELYDTKMKFASLPAMVAQMMNLTDIIEQRRSILARLNPEYDEKYVQPCIDHSEELMRRVIELDKMFNKTRDVAEFPLQAAKAYQNIVDEINKAEQAAREAKDAADAAYRHVFPEGGESLLDQAIAARKRSEDLLREADELMRRLDKFRLDLEERLALLSQIEGMLESGRHNLASIKQELDGLPRDISRNIQIILDLLRRLVSTLEQTHARIDDLAGRIDGLRGRMEEFRAATTTGLEDPRQKIEESLQNLQKVKKELADVELRTTIVDRLRAQFDLNLRDLKLKIMLARQKAASIRISLGADRESTCIRTYEPEIEPSFTNNMVMYYAIKHEHQQDALLLYLGNRAGSMSGSGAVGASNDFMAVEMKNRRIRFVWNTGNAERMIQHRLPIQTNDQQLSKDSHWYKIEVKRFGSLANLTVQRVPDAHTPDPFEVSDTVSANEQAARRMDLDRSSNFYVGGLPAELQYPPRQIQSRSFAGCLYELRIDGRKVGLWNFTTNIGCDACKEGATEPIEPTMYSFNDDFGYGRTTQISDYKKNAYLVSFLFRTFDENALLFFSANPATRDFVAIYLKDGIVHFETHFGGGDGAGQSSKGTRLVVMSDEKKNTGAWVQLRAEREYKLAVLEIDKKVLEKELSSSSSSVAGSLDLARADVYFGGVTPNFSTIEYPRVVFKSFVGCMNSPQIDTTPINLQRIQSFGIEPGCLDKPIRVASFNGDGYIELDGHTIPSEKMEFSFTFKTLRKSGILLLSTFERKNRAKENNYYFFYLSDGYLNIHLNGGLGETTHVLQTPNLADGKYHTVTIFKDSGRSFRFFVDDEYESPVVRLVKGRSIESPARGGFFVGGTPYGYDNVNKGYASNFHGIIRDIVFDNKLVSFNAPVTFHGVGIGREGSSLDWLSGGGTDVVGSTTYTGHIEKTDHSIVGNLPPPKPGYMYGGHGHGHGYGYGYGDDTMMAIPAESIRSCVSTHHSLHTVADMDAIQFGDTRSGRANASYVQFDGRDKEFYGDFSLSFAFRSYYPNGILLTLTRHNGAYRSKIGKPVLVIALVNGQIVFRIKMSDRHFIELKSSPTIRLNDGAWHEVTAGRENIALWMNVDLRDRVQNSKLRRRLALKSGIQAFVGGLPEEYSTLFGNGNGNGGSSSSENDVALGSNSVSSNSHFLPTFEGFKGCVRRLRLNDRRIDFRSLPLPDGAGICYAKIEKGAYFRGENDSFAVYDDAFNIGMKADISFEFRTTKRAGILFAVSNGTNETPALAIELVADDRDSKDGGIIASVDLGPAGGGAFRARKHLPKYDLCDGRWHTVKVHYSIDSISLKIDHNEVVYGLHESKNGAGGEKGQYAAMIMGSAPYTSAPLYVGGLPRDAPSGALLSRQSFHGCIRNVEINDQRKDWLSDVALFNVQANACPAPAA